MNRRQFGLRMAALSAAPLLPALPAAAAQPLSGTAARIYPWAAQYARVHGHVSAAKIASAFKIPPAAAREVATQLIAKGVTAAPVAGLAKAIDPVSWDRLYSVKPAAGPIDQLDSIARKLTRKADLQGADEHPPTAATEAESEPMPEDQSTGSRECPRA